MSKNYISGFEKLARHTQDTDERYMRALLLLKENFTGFTKRNGFDPSHPEKLTPANKRQIRRYYNTLTELSEGQPVYKMETKELPKNIPRTEKNINAIKRAAQMKHGATRSKYIFVKYDGENIPKVEIRKGAPVFVNEKVGYARETILLNKKLLAVDPIGTVNSVGKLTEGAKFYRIIAGRHEFFNAKDLNTLGKKVVQLQHKYNSGNHAWENWLDGVMAFYSDELRPQAIINYEAKVKEDFRSRVKRENAKARRKRK